MPHHDPTEFPEPDCQTQECVWDVIGGKRVECCGECLEKILVQLKQANDRCCYDLDEGHAPPPAGQHAPRQALIVHEREESSG